ncbi:potassium channel beta subunit family protein [Pelagicoccus mobilis]|uniref:Aldo/keto reductase n=1 Tax=Pelagicoccus mobilis TaxID=415221 RepID=A0A934RW80_9BACT|nr:aldo/keto reductase [Pelagicoccus mobilis]MBK1875547.1 aldo/keto reductase [Pelagicoccus mobilis]
MQYRRLGKSGLQVSALSYGSWLTFGDQASTRTVETCLELAYNSGINFFDNAEAYANGQSEEVMGNAISKFGWARDTYVVSSKVFWGGEKPNQIGLSKKHVIEACEAALRRLRIDYLDLYYCHRPDPDTPIEETVRAMDGLIQQGKILYWGTSEWSAQEIMEAYSIARQYNLTPPTMEQPEYNLLKRHRFEVEYQRLFTQIGLGATTFSPLASGILTGKYNQETPENSRLAYTQFDWMQEKLERFKAQGGVQILQELSAIAEKLGGTLPQLSIAWLLKNPNVSSVILGASRTEQLEQNLRALDILDTLNEEIMDEIETAISPLQAIDA